MLIFITALVHRIYCKIILEYSGKSLFSGWFRLPWTQALSLYVGIFFFFFELTWIGFRTMAEFLTVLERARRSYKGPICYGCRAPLLLSVQFGKSATESGASSSGSATGMSRKVGRIIDWRETQQPGARQNSSFLQFLSAACVFQSVCVATVTPCARWCINAWMSCKIPN